MKTLICAVVASALVLAGCGRQTDSPMLSPDDITLTSEERSIVAAGQLPEAAFIDRLSGPREIVDGQTLNAKVQYLLEQSRPGSTPEAYEAERKAFASAATRAEARAATDRRWRIHTLVTRQMRHVEDLAIPGRDGHEIPIRIYHPDTNIEEPLPVLVYFHGGGFIFASIEAIDRAVRLIANEAEVIVVSVDCRLAPEHPYPAAHDDAQDAFSGLLPMPKAWAEIPGRSLSAETAPAGISRLSLPCDRLSVAAECLTICCSIIRR